MIWHVIDVVTSYKVTRISAYAGNMAHEMFTLGNHYILINH